MNRYLQLCWLAGAMALLSAGCTRERSRVVENGDPSVENHDYRGMLERARTRQTSAEIMAGLEQAIQRFQYERARLPTNLHELVTAKYLPEIATPPDGFGYTYDPTHGNVNLVSLPTEGGVPLPSDLTNENRAKLIDVNLPPPQ